MHYNIMYSWQFLSEILGTLLLKIGLRFYNSFQDDAKQLSGYLNTSEAQYLRCATIYSFEESKDRKGMK